MKTEHTSSADSASPRSCWERLARACTIAGLAILALPTFVTADPIRIGYISDLSGMGSFFGVPTSRGAALATHTLNAEGRPTKIFIEDTKSNASSSATAAIQLIEQRKVDGIICDLTQVCTAASPKALAAGIPLIYNSPAVSIEGSNPHAHRNFLDYKTACSSLAQTIRDRGLHTVGVITPHLEFGELCADGVAEIFPQHYAYRYNPGDDLRGAVLEFKRRKIEVAVQVGFEPDVVTWFQVSRTLQYRPVQAFVEIMLNDTVVKAAGDLLEGSIVAGFEDLPADFSSKLKQHIPGPDEKNIQSAAIGYNAVVTMRAAFAECPSKDLACLDQKLSNHRFGLMGFAGLQRGKAPYNTKIKEYRNGKLQALQPSA